MLRRSKTPRGRASDTRRHDCRLMMQTSGVQRTAPQRDPLAQRRELALHLGATALADCAGVRSFTSVEVRCSSSARHAPSTMRARMAYAHREDQPAPDRGVENERQRYRRRSSPRRTPAALKREPCGRPQNDLARRHGHDPGHRRPVGPGDLNVAYNDVGALDRDLRVCVCMIPLPASYRSGRTLQALR